MKRLFIFFILLSSVGLSIVAQQPAREDVIYLKNGEKYSGKITLRTEQVIMIQLKNGSYFQIQLSDIKEITQEEIVPNSLNKDNNNLAKGNFAGLVQLGGCVSNIKGAISNSPGIDASLAFGAKKLFNRPVFLGLGAGVEYKNNRVVNFAPVFMQLKNNYTDNTFSPATSVKIGYALPLQKDYSGGVFLNVAGGVSYKTSSASTFFAGAYVQIQQTEGDITETLPQGKFISKGNATLNSVGIITSLIL
ncbi:MAG: hypothetical protein QM751_11355 [Paludibacteraceae bacterium]